MVRLIEGVGTPESSWQAWPGLAAVDTFDLRPLPASAVVVAPHPDDEVLGVGGTLALLRTARVSVRVVAVSDGEASHPHSPTVTPTQLADIRRAEQDIALGRLGLDRIQLHRCGLPDGHLDRHEADLTDTLTRLLDEHTWCLTTWAHDGPLATKPPGGPPRLPLAAPEPGCSRFRCGPGTGPSRRTRGCPGPPPAGSRCPP